MINLSLRKCTMKKGNHLTLYRNRIRTRKPTRTYHRKTLLKTESESVEQVKVPEKKNMMGNFKKLVLLAKPQAKLIAGSLGLLLVSSAVSLIFPTAMGRIVDVILSEDGSVQLRNIVLILGGLSVFGGVSVFLRTILVEKASQRIVADLRSNLYSKLLNHDLKFFDDRRTGELINRLADDTQEMTNLLVNNFSTGIRRIIEGLGGLIILFYLSYTLTFAMLIVLPPVFLGAVTYGRRVKKLATDVTDAMAATTSKAEQKLSAIRTVKAFVSERLEAKKYSHLVDNVFHLSVKVSYLSGILYGVTYVAVNVALLVVLYQGGNEILAGSITPGELTSFLFYSLYVAFAFSGMSTFWAQLVKALGSSQRVFDLMDEKITITGDKQIDKVVGKITFKDVIFAYPSRPEEVILQKLNLSLEPGKSMAIVGYSGTGKSTITSLVGRFYDPDSGDILIDDTNIRDIDPKSLRSHIGYVPQEISLFSGTIAENIAYANPEASMEDIEKAAKEANANIFIEKFSDGYNTEVGEKGTQLSGGQKQRIGIARALLKNPQILILDEATSSLDVESEYLIQVALERLMKGRTVLLIAHRLSTIKNADTIGVLNDGVLAEQGNFKELMASKDGIFRQLVEKQMSSF